MSATFLVASAQVNVNTMDSQNTNDKRNLTAVTWAHAVNSQQKLMDVLHGSIDMIEADIVFGTLNNMGNNIPIMAHPPATNSDLSLEDFLQNVQANNENYPNNTKGIKLDFKSIEVFEKSLTLLQNNIPNISYPIWLNADIISGPFTNLTETIPVNAERFLSGCLQFKNAVLSIGWTTYWNSSLKHGEYSEADIQAMLTSIKSNNLTESKLPITFPVRAGIAANSKDNLLDLLHRVEQTNDCTLTIWSSPNDYVNVEKLRQLIFDIGFDRIYIDVPDKLANQLNLDNKM